MNSHTSIAITCSIRVETRSFYVPAKSDVWNGQYFFGYRIRISNEGPDAVQLVSRHWVIEDAQGRVEEVRGPGVVGEQPHLEPGDHFEYTSACPLPTRYGNMKGTYHFQRNDGTTFDADIGSFALICPHIFN